MVSVLSTLAMGADAGADVSALLTCSSWYGHLSIPKVTLGFRYPCSSYQVALYLQDNYVTWWESLY
jgi:hypothetical protein